uniref:NADH-ubiquinone oxidoreductase chain 3 n=2 Tax=Anthoceros TaxID=3233 RepID=A0A6M8B091_ANTPU|nr:NADH dehydrogenase subunit 3 [Anthoceros punctatus]YP_009863177.1 NADH dehydrogenase subunit 3 [Anthoceros agrestis]QKD76591.1 NADH dehydrogenase subunit 3 [Anthoceros punctatus]QKD76633.1 NADH dehydrogenase subunit 3 [Anthoceros agrestis]
MEFVLICVYLVISLPPLLILIGVSFLFASSSSLAYPEKLSAHECGFDFSDDARSRFDIRFHPVFTSSITSDLEVTSSSPWAVSPNKIGLFGFWSTTVSLLISTIGSVYEWKKGASDWE